MRRIITVRLLIFTLSSCKGQRKDNELALSISGNIKSIGLSKLHFFAKELVGLGTDSSFLLRLKKQVDIYDKMHRKTIGDTWGYQITLYQLYTKIKNQKVLSHEEGKSREALSKLFKKGEQLDFSVDDSLIL